jgi:hypothetical protein
MTKKKEKRAIIKIRHEGGVIIADFTERKGLKRYCEQFYVEK